VPDNPVIRKEKETGTKVPETNPRGTGSTGRAIRKKPWFRLLRMLSKKPIGAN